MSLPNGSRARTAQQLRNLETEAKRLKDGLHYRPNSGLRIRVVESGAFYRDRTKLVLVAPPALTTTREAQDHLVDVMNTHAFLELFNSYAPRIKIRSFRSELTSPPAGRYEAQLVLFPHRSAPDTARKLVGATIPFTYPQPQAVLRASELGELLVLSSKEELNLTLSADEVERLTSLRSKRLQGLATSRPARPTSR